jgi:hypothetical protein
MHILERMLMWHQPMGLSASTLKTIVKNLDVTERSDIQCGTFSAQWKSLKHSMLEELESALAA